MDVGLLLTVCHNYAIYEQVLTRGPWPDLTSVNLERNVRREHALPGQLLKY